MNSAIKPVHVDQRYLKGLVENVQSIIKEIYERFSGKVKNYILNNNGAEDDAADIMQEALIDIYRQAKKGLQLTCPFEAFLLLICKRKWLNELKKRSVHRVTNEPEDLSIIDEDAIALAEQLKQQDEKRELFLAMFKKLGEKCQEIIRACLSGSPQEELAASMGLSYAYLRKKKSECMAELIKNIRSNQQS